MDSLKNIRSINANENSKAANANIKKVLDIKFISEFSEPKKHEVIYKQIQVNSEKSTSDKKLNGFIKKLNIIIQKKKSQ